MGRLAHASHRARTLAAMLLLTFLTHSSEHPSDFTLLYSHPACSAANFAGPVDTAN